MAAVLGDLGKASDLGGGRLRGGDATAHFRPAVLNALEAEVRTIPRSAAASETVVNGTCSAPGKTIGAWISSARTQPSCCGGGLGDSRKLLALQHCPRGVVRVAEDQARVACGKRPARASRSSSRPSLEWHLHHGPAGLGDHREERVIDGRVDDHSVARFGQHANEVVEARDDVVERRHLRGIDLPPEAPPREPGERVPESSRVGTRVAGVVDLDRTSQRLANAGASGKSISATQAGRTSSGYQVHLALRRARRSARQKSVIPASCAIDPNVAPGRGGPVVTLTPCPPRSSQCSTSRSLARARAITRR